VIKKSTKDRSSLKGGKKKVLVFRKRQKERDRIYTVTSYCKSKGRRGRAWKTDAFRSGSNKEKKSKIVGALVQI